MRIAVIGRPERRQVLAASTRCSASERVIVSDIAGTTRDAIDTALELDGRRLLLVDTAGLRRRTKVAGTVDYYAQLRSERAAERADVAIVVCDASEGVTAEDLRVAELAMKTGCATLRGAQQVGHRAEEAATSRTPRRGSAKQLRQRPPVIACSAYRGRSVAKLLAQRRRARRPPRRAHPDPGAQPLRRRRGRQAPAAAEARQAPAPLLLGPGRAPRRRASRSRSTTARLITRDWAYHLENRLRERYGLEGVPLVIDFIPKRQRVATGRDGASA